MKHSFPLGTKVVASRRVGKPNGCVTVTPFPGTVGVCLDGRLVLIDENWVVHPLDNFDSVEATE
jgi:hypothetical protein